MLWVSVENKRSALVHGVTPAEHPHRNFAPFARLESLRKEAIKIVARPRAESVTMITDTANLTGKLARQITPYN